MERKEGTLLSGRINEMLSSLSNIQYLLLFSCLVVSDSFATPFGALPGSSVHEILQARLLEWVTISSFRDLPNLQIKSSSLNRFFTAEPPGKPSIQYYIV